MEVKKLAHLLVGTKFLFKNEISKNNRKIFVGKKSICRQKGQIFVANQVVEKIPFLRLMPQNVNVIVKLLPLKMEPALQKRALLMTGLDTKHVGIIED